jgi:hypothetical protein
VWHHLSCAWKLKVLVLRLLIDKLGQSVLLFVNERHRLVLKRWGQLTIEIILVYLVARGRRYGLGILIWLVLYLLNLRHW